MMSSRDFRSKKEDGTDEDMCGECLSHVYNIDLEEPKEYLFESLEEGVTRPKPTSSSWD
jgi:hypothetical protein